MDNESKELAEIKEVKDVWDEFLKKLDDNNYSDHKKFLEAIKNVSEITVDNIDDEETRKEINGNLKIIEEFIENYKDKYYEISLIKGFKTTNDAIKSRDYYYYIADQKMKASVYYCRYLNFVWDVMGDSQGAESKLQALIAEIKKKSENINIPVTAENIISIIDNMEYEPKERDAIFNLRQTCVDCVEKIKASEDINRLVYMLFNNMLREIRYFGGAYQYLWHWESRKKHLFRNVGKEDKSEPIKYNSSKSGIFKDTFNFVITHMNHPQGLHSYSEDPYIDIYKYVKIPKDNNKHDYLDISREQDGLKVQIQSLKNNEYARFEIVKNAQVNSIGKNGSLTNFYNFIQNEEPNKGDEIAFLVEPYPVLPKAEKNEKDTPINIKKFLESYLKTWGCNPQGIMHYVSDDKEVIACGKFAGDPVKIYEENIEDFDCDNLKDNCRYVMNLSKEAFIYLILKLMKPDIDLLAKNAAKKFKVSSDENKCKAQITSIFEGKDVGINISGHITSRLNYNKIKYNILIECSATSTFIKNKKDELDGNIKKIYDKLIDEIKERLKDYFADRYKEIIDKGDNKKKYPVADSVLYFIEKEGYQCPSYIDTYTEYKFEDYDDEISLLKDLIFKEGSLK